MFNIKENKVVYQYDAEGVLLRPLYWMRQIVQTTVTGFTLHAQRL